MPSREMATLNDDFWQHMLLFSNSRSAFEMKQSAGINARDELATACEKPSTDFHRLDPKQEVLIHSVLGIFVTDSGRG
jgi:hypothetical protein